MNVEKLRPLFPIIAIILGFLIVYALWVASLFRPRKDSSQRRWRGEDWIWVPLAGLTGVLLLALWWQMRHP